MSPRPVVRAASVMASGEILNSYPLIHAIESALPKVPWAVHLADRQGQFRLLVADFDAHGDPVRAAADAAAFATVLDQTGVAHVVCESGPTGGRHVWMATEPLPAVWVAGFARLLRATYTSVDITPLLNPATGACRPPGAPHRLGGASTLLSGHPETLTAAPVTTRAALAAVAAHLSGAPLPQPSDQPTGRTVVLDPAGTPRRAGHRRPLSSRVWAAIDSPAGNDASATLAPILLAAARASWSLADVATLVDRPGFEHVRTMRRTPTGPRLPRPTNGSNASTATLDRLWRHAVDVVAATPNRAGADPTFEDREALITRLVAERQAHADSSPGRWTHTRTSVTDRLVFDALCQLTLHGVTTDVEASIRTLALLAGPDRESVRLALKRLADDGWIAKTRENEGINAAHFNIDPQGHIHKLRENSLSQADAPPTPARGPLLHHLTRRTHLSSADTFDPAGELSRLAGLVYSRLPEAPTTDQMVQLTGLARGKVTAIFERLASFNLIDHHTTPGAWVHTGGDTLTTAAVEQGTAGIGERRRGLYAIERAAWAWWQAELEWMRAPRARRAKRGNRRASSAQLALIPDRHDNLFGAHPRRADRRADYATARQIVLASLEEVTLAA